MIVEMLENPENLSSSENYDGDSFKQRYSWWNQENSVARLDAACIHPEAFFSCFIFNHIWFFYSEDTRMKFIYFSRSLLKG